MKTEIIVFGTLSHPGLWEAADEYVKRLGKDFSEKELKEVRLPVVVVWDLSIYGMVRILVVQKALKKANEAALLKQINETNRKYKAFKYYLDEEGNLVLDACILCRGQKVDGELVYILFNTLARHLEEACGQGMKVIWG